MTKGNSIEVTSHVSRDFLQNAAYFSTMPKLVWEYVANSLDAAKEGTVATVVVEITSHGITISDNGQGMSRAELRTFFQMHGENIQRLRGRRVRGRFGTGKCAAFGLANCLRIDTVQSGLRNVVQLRRQEIERARSGEPFPVQDVVVDEQTDQEDGTIVEVREFNLRRPNVNKTIAYVERHLSRYRRRAHVSINGHVCKFEEPPFIDRIERVPPVDVAGHVGSVSLTIKVSPVPLDVDTRGIDILSYGIWHETTLAGIDGKERANHIFGDIDVPILEDGDWPVPAFDNTRNNVLNRQNPVVVVLLGWLSEELESVRLLLVERARERRKSELAKQLVKEAQRIADFLNEDFESQEIELELRKQVARRSGGRRVTEILDEQGQLWPGDGGIPTPWETTGQPHGDGGQRGKLAGDGETPRPGPTARPGQEPGTRKSTAEGNRRRRRAVFSIDYENATAGAPRARYHRDTETIFINMDHPQIHGAFEAGGRVTESRQFREMCFEVAVVEYAIVLQYKHLEEDEQDASEALDDVRRTINRVADRFACQQQV